MNGAHAERPHAVVTGAGSGIGAAIAAALANDGARVTLMGRTRAELDACASALPAAAGALAVVADVADDDSVRDAFTAARAAHGPISILVNNAGIAHSVPFAKMERSLWDATIGVNLTGTYLCAREVIDEMVTAKFGRIVTIASTAGLVGGPYIAAYCAAKHGTIGLTRSLAAEFGGKGITINAVCPGFTDTPMLERTLERIAATTGRTTQTAAAALLARNPLGRFVRADEVASTVVWLCSIDAGAINGQAIVIDGGEVAR